MQSLKDDCISLFLELIHFDDGYNKWGQEQLADKKVHKCIGNAEFRDDIGGNGFI